MVDRTLSAGVGTQVGGLQANKVLRSTYMLLGMTLAFAASMAWLSKSMNVPYLGFLPTIIGFFGLLYLVNKTANSGWGLVSIFLFTGFMGFTLGPILNAYMATAQGTTLVTYALGSAAAVFVGLSAIALVTKKDFSFLGGFIAVGFIVLIASMVLVWLFELSAFHTALSAGFVLVSSALILWQTSAIVHGGETNYILATSSLFVSFYNLFVSLLQIFGVMGDD